MSELRPLSPEEKQLMAHVLMWGSEGYPVGKVSGKWYWQAAFGVKGSPIAYKTKKEAVAAFERWYEMARERKRYEYEQEALRAYAPKVPVPVYS